MFEFILKLVINTICSLALGALTVAIANGHYHQHWNYWVVTLAWFIFIVFGFVIFKVADGDFDLL